MYACMYIHIYIYIYIYIYTYIYIHVIHWLGPGTAPPTAPPSWPSTATGRRRRQSGFHFFTSPYSSFSSPPPFGAKYYTPDLTNMTIHRNMSLNIRWIIPVQIHWTNETPWENATEHPLEMPLTKSTMISEVLISGVQLFAPTLLSDLHK